MLSMLGKLLVGGCGFVEAVGTWRKWVCLQHLFETLKLCWMFFLVDGAFGPRSLLLLFFKTNPLGRLSVFSFDSPVPSLGWLQTVDPYFFFLEMTSIPL